VYDTVSTEEVTMTSDAVFKSCGCCRHRWPDRDSFLNDSGLEAIGYQANHRQLHLGLFFFNHATCRSTLTVPADRFTDLYQGPVFEKQMTRTPDCPGHCLHEDDLSRCPVACECAFVREVLQVIRRKLESAGSGDLPVNF
jgi:hypothetical protein